MIAVLFYSPLAFIIFGAITAIALFEFGNFFKKKNYQPNTKIFLGTGLAIYLLFALVSIKYISFYWLGLIPGILLVPLVYALFNQSKNSLISSLLMLSGYLYILLPLLLIHFLYTSDGDNKIIDFWPVLGMMLITWTSDTFAYLAGRFFGKTKLFERISPKKTWEGVLGGVLFSIIAAFIINYFDEVRPLLFWLSLALLIPVFGVLGDLFESLIKRTVDVKDSGDFIPGHGGILDRIDAMLFTIPLTYCMLILNNIL